jgi:hypothetical protein
MSHTGCVCLIVGDLETATMKEPWPKLGRCGTEKSMVCAVKTKLWVVMFPAILTLMLNHQNV